MMYSHVYVTRSAAVRAARAMCRKNLNSKIYDAYEGPDYEIHPTRLDPWGFEYGYRFKLRGPAAEAKGTENG